MASLGKEGGITLSEGKKTHNLTLKECPPLPLASLEYENNVFLQFFELLALKPKDSLPPAAEHRTIELVYYCFFGKYFSKMNPVFIVIHSEF